MIEEGREETYRSTRVARSEWPKLGPLSSCDLERGPDVAGNKSAPEDVRVRRKASGLKPERVRPLRRWSNPEKRRCGRGIIGRRRGVPLRVGHVAGLGERREGGGRSDARTSLETLRPGLFPIRGQPASATATRQFREPWMRSNRAYIASSPVRLGSASETSRWRTLRRAHHMTRSSQRDERPESEICKRYPTRITDYGTPADFDPDRPCPAWRGLRDHKKTIQICPRLDALSSWTAATPENNDPSWSCLHERPSDRLR